MNNYYIATEKYPFHLSVGAVILNNKGEALCHHFASLKAEGYLFKDLYLLMRETVEQGETLEQALYRGLREEMGAKVKIKAYLGSIVSEFPRGEKTTLYFLCELENMDLSKRKADDEEAGSEVAFIPIDTLIKKMNAQYSRYQRTDLDESSVLEKVKNIKQ